MDKKTKQKNLDFLADKFSNLSSIIFTNFKGLTAQDMSSIKKLAKEGGGEYKVVKNTITLKAIKKSAKETIETFVSGPCAVAFLPDDPAPLLKTLINFSKEHEALVLKGGIVCGELADIATLKKIAALPGRKELLASVVGGLNAPISNLAGCLHQMIFKLVSVINLIKNSSDVTSEHTQDGGSKDAKEGSR